MTLVTAPRPTGPALPGGPPPVPEGREEPEGAQTRRHSMSAPWLKSRGRDRPRRSRTELIALATLLVTTAVAYLWDLTASGYANSFYAAAVQAGTKSSKAFFFG